MFSMDILSDDCVSNVGVIVWKGINLVVMIVGEKFGDN